MDKRDKEDLKTVLLYFGTTMYTIVCLFVGYMIMGFFALVALCLPPIFAYPTVAVLMVIPVIFLPRYVRAYFEKYDTREKPPVNPYAEELEEFQQAQEDQRIRESLEALERPSNPPTWPR